MGIVIQVKEAGKIGRELMISVEGEGENELKEVCGQKLRNEKEGVAGRPGE